MERNTFWLVTNIAACVLFTGTSSATTFEIPLVIEGLRLTFSNTADESDRFALLINPGTQFTALYDDVDGDLELVQTLVFNIPFTGADVIRDGTDIGDVLVRFTASYVDVESGDGQTPMVAALPGTGADALFVVRNGAPFFGDDRFRYDDLDQKFREVTDLNSPFFPGTASLVLDLGLGPSFGFEGGSLDAWFMSRSNVILDGSQYSIRGDIHAAVPEPGTMLLLGTGVLAGAIRKKFFRLGV